MEPDGFPVEWYGQYSDTLGPRLQPLYSYSFKNGALPPSILDVYVVLLPKPGKDLTCCSSYRPIALLHAELKILTKVLATRLSIVLPALVDMDQTDFMPGKSTDTNLHSLFTHLQISHKTTGTRAVVSLDMAKAFDSVDWGYMKVVLEQMGFGTHYCKWVSSLYSKPRMAL